MTTLLADIITRKDVQSKEHTDYVARKNELQILLAEVVGDHADELKQIFHDIKYYGSSIDFMKGGYRYVIAFAAVKNELNIGFEANSASWGHDGIKIPFNLDWPKSKLVSTFQQAIRAVAARAYRGKYFVN